MITWPDPLPREIAKERCIFFLGAGVSATAVHSDGSKLPTWEEFLLGATSLVTDTDAKLQIEALINEKKLLIALQAIKDRADVGAYRKLLDQTFNKPGYAASDVHKTIVDLDAKVVITTNFDKIYESYCNSFSGSTHAYKVIPYKSADFADEIRSDTRLIVKAHGSIDQISDMIFTRAQYHQAKRDSPEFYRVLRALFVTNTIVFIGCGLDDPDITLLLEDLRATGRHEMTHYALVRTGSKNPFLVDDWRSTYNIKTLEYGPTHDDLLTDLRNLLVLVDRERAVLAGA